MPLFDRSASVEIGEPGKQGIKLSGFRIKFKGTKSVKKSANKCEVEIYNLSEETFQLIQGDNTVMILSAGYSQDEGEKQLFTGNITRVYRETSYPDIVTHIECFDGIRKLREKRISISYEAGSKVTTIVNDLISNLEFPLANDIDFGGLEFTNGFSFVGSTKDALSKVLDFAGYDWSIQDGSIQILEEDQKNDTGILLSPTSGLIGSPENLTETNGKLKKSKSKKQKYKVNSFLFPEIKVSDFIKLSSRVVEGFFKVLKHEFNGDNREGDWKSTLEVTEV
jgi:hypothetical protein